MRIAFGLVGLLIAVGIIVYIMASPGGLLDQISGTQSAAGQARQNVSQVAGLSRDDQTPAALSAKLEPQMGASKIDSILVTDLKAGGAYEKFWGLRRFDSIVAIGPLSVRDFIQSDEDADAFVLDAYQRQQPLTVVRNGQRLTLPDPALAKAPVPPGAPPGASPTAGTTPAPKRQGDPLQGQLDAIQKVPGH